MDVTESLSESNRGQQIPEYTCSGYRKMGEEEISDLVETNNETM